MMDIELPQTDLPEAPPAAPEEDAPIPAVESDGRAERPPHIPEKFWDPAAGAVRVDALARSYAELERKLSAPPRASEGPPDGPSATPPAGPGGYDVAIDHDLFAADPAVDAALHEAGFTPAQAQLVYDLAAERLLPLVGELAETWRGEAEAARLEAHFGGPEKWSPLRRQLQAWGRAHLPEDAYESLAASHDGVLALHAMMTGEAAAGAEPPLLRGGEAAEAQSPDSLRRMMRDPRYWRDRDPAFVQQVTDGFRRLYPGSV